MKIDRPAVIYILVHPETREIRYVGYTTMSLRERFKKHAQAQRNTRRDKWVRSLRPLIPEMVVVATVADQNAGKAAEVALIALLKGLGVRLVNGTIGGEGCYPTDETRAKMRASHIGKKLSDSHKAALRAHLNRPEVVARKIEALRLSRSPEWRAKIGASLRGRVGALKGRPWSKARRQAQPNRKEGRE